MKGSWGRGRRKAATGADARRRRLAARACPRSPLEPRLMLPGDAPHRALALLEECPHREAGVPTAQARRGDGPLGCSDAMRDAIGNGAVVASSDRQWVEQDSPSAIIAGQWTFRAQHFVAGAYHHLRVLGARLRCAGPGSGARFNVRRLLAGDARRFAGPVARPSRWVRTALTVAARSSQD